MQWVWLILCALTIQVKGQVYLKPSIGLQYLPPDTTSICTIPTYTGSFYSSGLQAGDTAYDFTLYSLNGDSLVLSQLLATGKPVLLVNGNYTCPVFRAKVNMINQVANTYAGLVHVIVIYTVEAHPTTPSPYFGFVNITTANQNAGILFSQPQTYLERKNIVDSMLQHLSIQVPVYLDGPCNNWWSVYGPAPNNAYLIQANGIVFAKHGWFDKNPIDYILCDLDSLLYNLPCSAGTGSGNFSIHQLDTVVFGNVGQTIYAHTLLINNNPQALTVSAKKIQKNHPATWQTAFCADVCYSPADDSITFTIPPNDTLDFSIDYFTDATPDTGSVKIGFRNVNNHSNQFAIQTRAITLGNSLPVMDNAQTSILVFPNPFQEEILIRNIPLNLNGEIIYLKDMSGRTVFQSVIQEPHLRCTTSQLSAGFYIIQLGKNTFKLFKVNQ